MIVHLFNPRLYVEKDHIGLCGGEGRTMTHHELSRGRITCPDCIVIYADNLKKGGTGYSSYREKRQLEAWKSRTKRKWKKKVVLRPRRKPLKE